MCWINLNRKPIKYLLYTAVLFCGIIACNNEDEFISTTPTTEADINWYRTEFREGYYKLQETWTDVVEMTENDVFTVDDHYILKNGSPFEIRGMVYVPGYPGYIPWEIENNLTLPTQLTERIDADLKDIKAMGANTIRFWHAPKYCYEAVRNTGGLYILQTIWIEGDPADFQDANFKESIKTRIRIIVDRIYSAYPDNNPPIVGFNIGNELANNAINSTNIAHPEIDSFSGNYIVTDSGISATEAFIAEMGDYLKTYEFNKYGRASLVSYANHIASADLLQVPFLDFRSHNVYSNNISYFRPNTQLGSSTNTQYQGWVEELKAMFPNEPLVITETGLSISPNAPHIGSPNYGYGGNTEAEQATKVLQNVVDIATATLPIAGVCIHEYLDAWWKYSLEDSYSQDPDDVEEWFGMVKLVR